MADVRVLFVCTGNICRSPTAEGVARHKLAQRGLGERVEVASAGLGDWHIGDPPDPRAIARARRRGYDLTALRARLFTSRDYHNFDLILAMDRGHRSVLARGRPATARARVHLFLDFVPGDSDIPGAPSVPGARNPGAPREVPDPYYGDIADYDYALDLIEPGAEGLIDMLIRDYL
jgi:protein-tyrosine phosphatase